ncbi:hypothetical protein KO507_05525 [Gilvimarinus agarilyticus]|uniref:DUF6942 family protein n=1 Tax=unclassified Gilvimarinus TaxID=2642066 RepID=UPI001C097F20|nr:MULTISPECIES: hypothetical protein [unclassified Gilvimarinus]MBU2885221.1 hypothetical protein [Gilvimarinus agarilyticus]MDO6570118.1 hypothetical protein [Gilvimarinus sp. 2_MG-2023]MDO6748290.1 hypothetical protein [Gilvimarinus sp. 1_MG-2023]
MVAGIGDTGYRLAFCVANRPPLDDYPVRENLAPLLPGELQHIVANTSNHWRKLFNVYAKVVYALGVEPGWPPTWQEFRDRRLLQSGSRLALLFTPPQLEFPKSNERPPLYLVAGKGYASALNIAGLQWLDAHFAVAAQQRVLVTPYLDYRQLSNERIERLVELIRRYALL